MRQLSQWVFEVFPGENVRVRVVSLGFQGSFVGVGLDQTSLKPLEQPDNTLTFVASKRPGQSHVAIFEFNFPSYAPEVARYELTISGSSGGSFKLTVPKSRGDNDRDLIFTVVEGGERLKERTDERRKE